MAGDLANVVYPDGYSITNQFNLLGQVTSTHDSFGVSLTNWFNNQGLLYAVQDAAGFRSLITFDVEDRSTNNVDVNGVTVTNTFDDLGRLLTRGYPQAWAFTELTKAQARRANNSRHASVTPFIKLTTNCLALPNVMY